MLAPGARIGSYEITGSLGAGGMGEVYRATDTRLNRAVALKVIPETLASDQDRVSRFRREAQLLASLNHPNVAAIYGLEEDASARALVMELVDGPTLADRLAQGPIPLEDVVTIAKQIAEAIEYAHEQGVIHRDLKPANIKITSSGSVKVLDFGLAKALERESGIDARSARLAESPTITSPAMTMQGVILGTAAYMSPEQAKGKPADRRADIWSFGVVLYEMLAHRSAFSGETVSETMAQVMLKEPDLTALPATTPPRIRELLRRCLVKDPRSRLQAIGEARIALEEVGPGSGGPSVVGAVSTAGTSREAPGRLSRWREWMWASVAIVSLLTAIALELRERFGASPPRETVRFEVSTPPRGGPEYPQGSASLSPDGRKLAFVALAGTRQLLWVHSFDSATAQPLESTEGIAPAVVVWSPDSRYIVFSAKGRLRKVAVTGGPSQVIGTVDSDKTGAWGKNDIILLGGGGGPLQRVSASGGELIAATTLDTERGEESHRFPTFLPDGRHFFYLASERTGANRATYIGALDSTDRRLLPGIESEVKYSSSGHLLFLRDGALMAQRFDARRLELAGEPFPVVDRFTLPSAQAAAYSLSENGTIAYRAISDRPESQLTWFDRSGKQLGVAGPVGPYNDIELAANDRSVVFEGLAAAVSGPVDGGRIGDIWVLDIESGVTSRVTSHPAREADPVWSADGGTIVFRSDRDGGHLYERRFGGVAEETLLFKGETRESPDQMSLDGRYVIFTTSQFDVWALPLVGDRQPVQVAATPFRESEGRVSPDGRWIAYISDESGRSEVYVQSFPKAAVRRQVSVAGGALPRWSHDGKELYYASPDQTVMAVALRAETATVNVSAPVALFQARFANPVEGQYAVSSTGRFLVNVPTAERRIPPVTVVLNWAAGLQR